MLSITYYDGVQYHRQDFINRDSDFFGNGVVVASEFPVVVPATPNMSFTIGQGRAWVDGYRIANDSTPVGLVVAAANTQPRIDIVQIGHDDINSTFSLVVKQGVPAASNPVEPGADAGYVKLWAINVPANAASIPLGNFIDRRVLVPLNVSGTQINLAGAAGTGQSNTFTAGFTQTFNGPVVMNNTLIGAYTSNGDITGVGADLNGNAFAMAIAAPAGTLVDPFGIMTGGGVNAVRAFSVSKAANIGLGIAPTYGLHQLGGGQRLQALATPAVPTVTPTGVAGSTSYTYFVVATDRNGNKTLASAGTTTATGNAALTGTNYNAISWAAVPGAVSYDVLKGTTATSLALGVTGTSINDIGQATAVYTAPTRNATADMLVDGTIALTGGITGDINFYVGNVNDPKFRTGYNGPNGFGLYDTTNAKFGLLLTRTGANVALNSQNNTLDDGTGASTFKGFMSLQYGGGARLEIKDTSAGVDAKKMDLLNANGNFQFRFVNDPDTLANIFMQVSRNGITPASVSFPYGTFSTTKNTIDDGTGKSQFNGDMKIGDSNVVSNGQLLIARSDGGGNKRTFRIGLNASYNFSIGDYLTGTGPYTEALQIDFGGNTILSGALTINGAGGSFANSKAQNGYQKLPGGLIIQWGRIVVASGTVITLPIAFPTAFSNVICNASVTAGDPTTSAAGLVNTLSTFTAYHAAGTSQWAVQWFAIGY